MANLDKRQQEINRRHQAQGAFWGRTHKVWAPQPASVILASCKPATVVRHTCNRGVYGG